MRIVLFYLLNRQSKKADECFLLTRTVIIATIHVGLKFEFNVALSRQRPYGLLGTGSPGRPP